MSGPWTDQLDLQGNPHASTHRDGHRVAWFPEEGWWAYHRDHRWAPPLRPLIGPQPQGPFETLQEAKRVVEAQGFAAAFPFEHIPQSHTQSPRI